MKENAPERPMYDLKRKGPLLRERDRAVESVHEVDGEMRRDFPVPGPRRTHVLFGERPNDDAADHSDCNVFFTSSHGSPSSGVC